MKRILVAAMLAVALPLTFALGGCGVDKAQLAQEASDAAKGDLPVQTVTATDKGDVTVKLTIPRGFLGNGGDQRCADMANSIIAKVDGAKSVTVVDGNGETVGEYRKP
jgi:hypothetical protein